MESSILTQVVVPVCLFLVMFGMGLSLTLADFSRVLRYPRPIFIGLVGQMLILPLIGFAVAMSVANSPALAMGIMLLAACPGGTTSNLICYLAKGDVALSISLTAVSSVLTIITIPLIVFYSMDVFLESSHLVELPVSRIIGVLFAITLLPVFLGMLMRYFKKEWAERLEKKINIFSGIFLLALVTSVLVNQGDVIFSTLSSVWFAVSVLNITTMMVALCMAVITRLRASQAVSLTVEVGVQNSALAILLATTLLNAPEMALPAAVYTLVMYFSGSLLVIFRQAQYIGKQS